MLRGFRRNRRRMDTSYIHAFTSAATVIIACFTHYNCELPLSQFLFTSRLPLYILNIMRDVLWKSYNTCALERNAPLRGLPFNFLINFSISVKSNAFALESRVSRSFFTCTNRLRAIYLKNQPGDRRKPWNPSDGQEELQNQFYNSICMSERMYQESKSSTSSSMALSINCL